MNYEFTTLKENNNMLLVSNSLKCCKGGDIHFDGVASRRVCFEKKDYAVILYAHCK